MKIWHFCTHASWTEIAFTFRADSYSMLVIIKILFLTAPACVLPTFRRISFKKLGLMPIRTLFQVGIDKCCTKVIASKKILVHWWNFQDRIGTVHASIMAFWTVASILNYRLGQVLICCIVIAANTFTVFSFLPSQHSILLITLNAKQHNLLIFFIWNYMFLQSIENRSLIPAETQDCFKWDCILIEEDQCWVLFDPQFID